MKKFLIHTFAIIIAVIIMALIFVLNVLYFGAMIKLYNYFFG